MSFELYVDSLAKRGIIDGHIAEMLVGKHRDEVTAPFKPVRDALNPILCEVWSTRNGDAELVALADKIDDELSKLEGGAK